MPRYIDAGDLKRRFRWWAQGHNDLIQYALPSDIELFDRFVDSAPTADVEEVKHGEWIQDTSPHRGLRFVCNKCKMALATLRVGVDSVSYTVGDNIANYCPFCGAKMDGKENE